MKGVTVAESLFTILTIVAVALILFYANDKFGFLRFPGGQDGGGGGSGGNGNHITPGDSGRVACIMEYAKANATSGRKCDCGVDCEEYASWIVQYSSQYGVPDPLLVVALMMQESSCNQYGNVGYGTYCNGVKKSSAGAVGLMQVMPSTGKGSCGYDITDLCDPQKNIECGIRVLRSKYDQCVREGQGTWDAALSAYNTGRCTSSVGTMFASQVNDRSAKLTTVAANQCSIA